MYSRCLFCESSLGSNPAFEEMPIGRRFAFDPHRGRLWIVCRFCARWNLTPIDERWEAIEVCERAFRTTRIRVTSANIGLAELPGDVTLIRIGRPLPAEFAAWRYGRQFLARRYRKAFGAAGRAALVGVGPALGLLMGPGAALAVAGLAGAAALGLWRTPAARIPLEGSETLRINLQHVHRAALIADQSAPEGWAVRCDHLPEPRPPIASLTRNLPPSGTVTLTGSSARAAVAALLPHLNRIGGDPDTVVEAAEWVQAAGGAHRAFRGIAESSHVRPALVANQLTFATLHEPVRLALEMAIHEDEERRHLEGELSVLTWMWRREEQLAAIADGLGLPGWLPEHLGRLRAASR